MRPILIDWGPLVIPTWHLLFALGAISAHRLLLYLNKEARIDLDSATLNQGFIVAYIAGYFGARALNIIVDREPYSDLSTFVTLLFSLGGLVFYGGLITSVLVTTGFFIWRRQSLPRCLDLSMPSVLLGLGIGRIGCFFNGCDFGKPVAMFGVASAWWAVTFPSLEDQTPRIPVQLLESATALALSYAASRLLIQKRFSSGLIGVIALGGYCVARFLLEFLRGDERGWVWHPSLSTSQFISIMTMLLLVPVTALILRAKVRDA